MRGDVVGAYFQLVARCSGGSCIAADPNLTEYMPTSQFEVRSDLCKYLTREMGDLHLSRKVLHAANLPGHLLACIGVPTSITPKEWSVETTLLDPLGKSHAGLKSRTAVATAHGAWISNEFARVNRNVTYSVVSNPAALLPERWEELWWVRMYLSLRLPTVADLSGNALLCLMLVTGTVYLPLYGDSEIMIAAAMEQAVRRAPDASHAIRSERARQAAAVAQAGADLNPAKVIIDLY